MAFDRKSLEAWATAAAESTLRGGGPTRLVAERPQLRIAPDPAGSRCRFHHAGHTPHQLQAGRAAELRTSGLAEPVRCTGFSHLEAGDLTWSDDAVPGSDATRVVSRLEIERADGTTFALHTHDRRAVAPVDACDGEGLRWVPRFSILFVPSWSAEAIAVGRPRGEATSWPTISARSTDEPWLPCPIAPPKRRSRSGL